MKKKTIQIETNSKGLFIWIDNRQFGSFLKDKLSKETKEGIIYMIELFAQEFDMKVKKI